MGNSLNRPKLALALAATASAKETQTVDEKIGDLPDQPCLNKFLTEVDRNVNALNKQLLRWLQKDSSTRYSGRGVIAIDNVLIDRDGKFIKDVDWFWDNAEQRNKIARDYICAKASFSRCSGTLNVLGKLSSKAVNMACSDGAGTKSRQAAWRETQRAAAHFQP